MGNNIAGAKGGGKKRAKVMKTDGEIFKLKIPTKVCEVVKDYPGHVLLESKAVKQYGIRANPLDPEEYLEPGKIYFLVELPKLHETTDKSVMEGDSSVQVKLRLPKAEMDKVIGESRDEMEVVDKIVDLYVQKKAALDLARED